MNQLIPLTELNTNPIYQPPSEWLEEEPNISELKNYINAIVNEANNTSREYLLYSIYGSNCSYDSDSTFKLRGKFFIDKLYKLKKMDYKTKSKMLCVVDNDNVFKACKTRKLKNDTFNDFANVVIKTII